ncbi:MAG: SpaA isopeptide-forming pilin-related protein, partial [Pirellulaceae bacterium]
MRQRMARLIHVLASAALLASMLVVAGVTGVSAQDTATLTVTKVVENGWNNDDPSDWDITIDNGTDSFTETPDPTKGEAVFADIPVGTYTVVEEKGPQNYRADFSDDGFDSYDNSVPHGTVTLTVGDEATVTITNVAVVSLNIQEDQATNAIVHVWDETTGDWAIDYSRTDISGDFLVIDGTQTEHLSSVQVEVHAQHCYIVHLSKNSSVYYIKQQSHLPT